MKWMIKMKMPSGRVYCVAELVRDGQRIFCLTPVGQDVMVKSASGWKTKEDAEKYLSDLLGLNPQLASGLWEVTEALLPQ